MPLANQYGVDLGNIFATESAIKTARLNRKAKGLAIEKEEAGRKLRKNALDKRLNKDQSKESMIAKGISGPEPKPFEALSAEEENRLSSIAPNVASQIQKTEQQQQQQEALKNMYIHQGDSEDIATYKSQLDIDDTVKFEKLYKSKNDEQKTNIRNGLAQQGQMIQNILETSAQNPEQANKMFIDFKTNTLKKINELRKNNQNEQADQLEESMKRVPNSLIGQDGKFNTSYLMVSLGKLNSMLTTAESFQEEQKSNREFKNKLALEKQKDSRPKGTPTKLEKLYTLLDNETDSERRKKIKSAIDMEGQPSMTSLLTNMNTVKDAQAKFSSKLGLDDPYKLATIDTRKLTPEQQAEAKQLSSVIVKGLGANAKEADKKMAQYGALSEQMQNAISNYENVGDFRLVDETVKKYFSNYFGLSEKELESSEAAQAFQSMLNIKIKADSGSAVSGNEMVRNTLETATPFMSKDKILLGIKNVAKRQIGSLKGLKKVMGDVAFNLKYGSVLKNYEDIANAVEDEKSGEKDKLSELRNKNKTSRVNAYNLIKQQRPNATDEQINAYLDSKGY